ncbi:MAG: tetratricopeptide repeat protein [Bacteroidia bacterium]
MKSTFALLFFLGIVSIASAQNSKRTSAYLSLQNGQTENAIALIEEAIKHEKTAEDPKTWYYRGLIYTTAMGNEEMREKYPNLTDLAFESYLTARKYDEKEKFDKEINENLKQLLIDAYNTGAKAYTDKDFKAASQAFESYLAMSKKVNPDQIDTAAIFYTAQAYVIEKDMENAQRTLKKLAELDYQDPWVYSSLHQMELNDGDTAEAIKYIEQGRKFFPEDVLLSNMEVNLYLKLGQTDVLIEKLRKASELDRSNTSILVALANVYDKAGKIDSAIMINRRALAREPNNFEANYNLGIIYYNQGVEIVNQELNETNIQKANQLKAEYKEIFSEALPYLEKAHEIDPEDKNTMISLREIYLRLDKREKAEALNALMQEK